MKHFRAHGVKNFLRGAYKGFRGAAMTAGGLAGAYALAGGELVPGLNIALDTVAAAGLAAGALPDLY